MAGLMNLERVYTLAGASHSIRETLDFGQFFFPKQFTIGVLNATLDLIALVLVGVGLLGL